MKKSKFSPAQIKSITGATKHELVDISHYHAPPYLEVLREKIKQSLVSSGGRPTLQKAELVRKVRFSEEIWNFLTSYSNSFSQKNISISPAQIASFLLEETIQEIEARIKGNFEHLDGLPLLQKANLGPKNVDSSHQERKK